MIPIECTLPKTIGLVFLCRVGGIGRVHGCDTNNDNCELLCFAVARLAIARLSLDEETGVLGTNSAPDLSIVM